MPRFYPHSISVYKKRAKGFVKSRRVEHSHLELLDLMAKHAGFLDWKNLVSKGTEYELKQHLHHWETSFSSDASWFEDLQGFSITVENEDSRLALDEGIELANLEQEGFDPLTYEYGPFRIVGVALLTGDGDAGLVLDLSRLNYGDPDSFNDIRGDTYNWSFGTPLDVYWWQELVLPELSTYFHLVSALYDSEVLGFYVYDVDGAEGAFIPNPKRSEGVSALYMAECDISMRLFEEGLSDEFRLLQKTYGAMDNGSLNARTFQDLKQELGVADDTNPFSIPTGGDDSDS